MPNLIVVKGNASDKVAHLLADMIEANPDEVVSTQISTRVGSCLFVGSPTSEGSWKGLDYNRKRFIDDEDVVDYVFDMGIKYGYTVVIDGEHTLISDWWRPIYLSKWSHLNKVLIQHYYSYPTCPIMKEYNIAKGQLNDITNPSKFAVKQAFHRTGSDHLTATLGEVGFFVNNL